MFLLPGPHNELLLGLALSPAVTPLCLYPHFLGPGQACPWNEQVTATGSGQPACGPFSALLPMATYGALKARLMWYTLMESTLDSAELRSYSALLLRDIGQVTLPF